MVNILLGLILASCNTKHILIKTKPIDGVAVKRFATNMSNMSTYDDAGDYSANVQAQSLRVGDPFDLKCNSPKEIKGCYFSREGGNTIYRVRKGATFEQNRLQALSDVSY